MSTSRVLVPRGVMALSRVCVPTSRTGRLREGWTNFVSYSFITSPWTSEASFDCWLKEDRRNQSWTEMSVA